MLQEYYLGQKPEAGLFLKCNLQFAQFHCKGVLIRLLAVSRAEIVMDSHASTNDFESCIAVWCVFDDAHNPPSFTCSGEQSDLLSVYPFCIR